MYYRMTMNEADVPFYVHRYMAMHRPTWSPEERKQKIAIYGGSRVGPPLAAIRRLAGLAADT
jgi:hypothetical protein